MAYTDNPNGFWCAGSLLGQTHPVLQARLDVNQTIHAGDALIAASGYLQIALYTSVVIVGVSIMNVTASASVYQWIDYVPALPDVAFVGQCSSGTTPTIADLWTTCDIEGTTGIMELNEDGTSYNVAVPFELWDKTEGYAAYARLKFVFKKSIWNISA